VDEDMNVLGADPYDALLGADAVQAGADGYYQINAAYVFALHLD
jgi:hypothetical protein